MRGEEVKIYVVLAAARPAPKAYRLSELSIIARANLASFKVPRYIEFRKELPKTPSDKVAKHVLRAEKADLRIGSWDREKH